MYVKISVIVGLVLLLPTAVLSATSNASQHYKIDRWSTDNGLPQNTVRAITQTRDGYIWFTTFDGLVRFDGVKFTIFDRSNTPALSSNRFTNLYQDPDGTLWAGTEDGGLTSYHDGVFRSYTTKTGFPSDAVGFIGPDLDGETIFFVSNGQFHFRGGKFVPAPGYDPHVTRYYLAATGEKWLIDANSVRQVVNGRTTVYDVKINFTKMATDINFSEDDDGFFWIGDLSGIYRLKDGTARYYTQKDGAPATLLRPQCEDNDGNLWLITDRISSQKNGLATFRDGRFSVYGPNEGITLCDIAVVFKDREGEIWIGSSIGLLRIQRQLITTYSAADGLPNREVYPIYQDRSGTVWAGTIFGLSRFKDGAFITDPPGNRLPVTALYQDSERRLWIGTVGGLTWYQNGKFTDPDITKGTVWAILQDRDGYVWAASERGLFKFSGENVVAFYSTNDGLPSNEVKVIHQDRDGTLWFGTYGGLARMDGNRFVAYTSRQGLAGDRVRSIYEDADGTLWIGTYDDGLSRFKGGKFFNYTVRCGLFNNGVFQIFEDRQRNFWISCNRGIYRVSKQQLDDFAAGKISEIYCVPYGKQDGMVNVECNGGRQPAGIAASDGKFWFPTQDGIAVIDPVAESYVGHPPPVLIEAVTLDHSLVDFRQSITLKPGEENLEISYVGLSYVRSDQVKFKYKLEGQDAGWVDAGTRRTAYYSHLTPGSYTFRVIAATSDGVWNGQGATLVVVVLAPFYRTWWFLALVVAVIVGILYIAFRLRVAQIERRQREQEAFSLQLIESQEAERRRIAVGLHDSLGQQLLVIKNWAAISLNIISDDNRARESLSEISGAASQAINEVREVIYNLRPYQLDKIGLTDTIRFMIEKAGAAASTRFRLDLDNVDNLFSRDSEITIYRIVQEAVNNVLKHSLAALATIAIKHGDTEVKISIEDNGCGFAAEQHAAPRRGFGLTGIIERVRMLGGEYSINSVPDKGTRIVISLPVTNQKESQ